MANYRELKGDLLQTVSSDPPSPKTGQIWYNSTLGKIRVGHVSQAWSSGGDMNTTEGLARGSAGTLTAGLAAGGHPTTTDTEEYDGTSWTETADLTTARNNCLGCGTQTAAVIAGGHPNPAVSPGQNFAICEEYDGSSWTESGDLGTGRRTGAVFGIQTAAVYAGGLGAGSPDRKAEVEEYNGTSWSEVTNLPTATGANRGIGTLTAGISVAGNPPPGTTTNETFHYDGTNWTEGGDVNTPRDQGGTSGLQTAGLFFGGNDTTAPADVAVTESYDGTTWTEVADLSTARVGGAFSTAGTNVAAFFAGGRAPGDTVVVVTEEFATDTTAANVQSVDST